MKRAALLVPLFLLYWLSATAAVHVFMHKQAFFEGWHHQEYAFERMLDRSAHRPFVYRALTPWMVNGIDAALPDSVKDRYQPAARAVMERYTRKLDAGYWTPELERKYMIAFVLMALFGVAALFALRDLSASAFPGQPAIRDAGPLFFGTLLPLSFMNGGFLYDFPELFFLFAAFALAWRVKVLPLLAVVVLATLNKETAALAVIFLSIVLWHRASRATWLRASVAMAALAAVTVVGLRIAYAGLPGSTMYDHILENLEFWSQPSSWIASMNVFVPLLPLPRGLNLVMIVPLVIVLCVGWRRRDTLLRRLLVASAAINLPLFFLFCWRDETRNLSLMYPAVYLNVCAVLVAAYGMGERGASGTDRDRATASTGPRPT